MLLLSTIVILVIAILAIIFAIQNVSVVAVNFLIWKLEGSLALILLLTFVSGFIVGLLILLPSLLRKKSVASGQNEKSKELQQKKVDIQ